MRMLDQIRVVKCGWRLEKVIARLLEFELTETSVTLVDRPPIQLELHPLGLRNWEGIVRLEDRGFLLVTDKFPETILGFVPKD